MKIHALGVLAATLMVTAAVHAKPPQITPIDGTNQPLSTPAVLDTFVLGSYDFAFGSQQGWTVHDLTAQGIYFHVDDFASVPGYTPISGTKSLWCGSNVNPDFPSCSYACGPGYGNNWYQAFTSTSFFVVGNANLSYQIRWDSEADYDQTRVQYYNAGGNWATLATYDGASGPLTANHVITSGNLPGFLRVRFLFTSDSGWSDEDCLWETTGACVIDNITITDSNGTVDSQTFETEAVGALTTADGDWTASTRPGYGLLGALHEGWTVLQQDPSYVEDGYVWGFFANPSVANYDCNGRGHPEQGVVPYVNAQGQYFFNEIRSPVLDWNTDENGAPIPLSTNMAFLETAVYRDNHLDDLVLYDWRVRFFVDGCPTLWQSTSALYFGTDKTWTRQYFDIGSLAIPGATQVQVALQVFDACPIFPSSCALAYQKCHTHAPLFTDIRVTRLFEPLTPAGTPPPRTMLAQNVPNPFNPVTTIRYTIAERSAVSLVVYDIAGRQVRELVDETHAARGGEHAVVWDGRDDGGKAVASGVYFYRLTAGDVIETRKMVLLK